MKVLIRKFKRNWKTSRKSPSEIMGGNGIGKTSILESISFVLTGKDQNGKDFLQVYDNRADRVADDILTTITCGPGKGWLSLQLQVDAWAKIMRSRAQKTDIDTNDFSNEFKDFYNFGTDFFFNQKETDQRAMFIDLMKSLLPNYDVAESQLRMKSLKKTQRRKRHHI